MNIKSCFLFCCLFFFVSSYVVFAQNGQDDFALLTQVGIQKKWKHNWSTDLAFRAFWNENVTEFNRGFVNAGIGYDINKRWSAGANFRFYEVKNLANFYEERFRLFIDLAYEQPIANRWSLSWRGRVQRQSYGGLSDDGYQPAKYLLRNKFALSYQHNWYWSFYASGEPFVSLKSPQKNNLVSNFRTEAGLKYRPTLHHSINVFFQSRYPTQLFSDTRYWIAGIGYMFKI